MIGNNKKYNVLHRCMLKVGVIGVGSMGQNHARIYSELNNLVGVNDASLDSASRVAKRLGTRAFNSIDELLANVDAVSVCTPTTSHFAVAKKAIEMGKAVLVEKPFTGDETEATILCELAEANKVTLASGFVERFNPVVEATKEMFMAGRFGRLVSISSRRVSSLPGRIRDVGVVKDLAIHDVDVIRYITGQEVRSVYALGGRMNGLNFEDHASFLMELDDSVIATVEVNWLTPMKVRQVSLTCSSGFAQMDYINQSLEFSSSIIPDIDDSDLSHIPMELDVRRVFVKKEEPLKRELEAFLNAAEMSARAKVDGWDALANLRVCNAALLSMVGGKHIDMSEYRESGIPNPTVA